MPGRFSVEAIFTAVDRMSRPVGKIESRIERMTRRSSAAMKSLDSAFGGVHKGIMRAGAAVAAGGVAAGAGLFEVVKTGAAFEQAITDVGAVSLMSRADVAELEVAARALGKSTKYSATEVAAGMELMGKAGATNADILAGIGPLLSAAAAEGADFEETASHISHVIKGMGMEWTSAQRVADVLTLASARTNSSISSLGESMSTASTSASQFKIPLEDMVAAVAMLQDVGLDASEAGTAMNTMLTKLSKPTDAVAAKMAAMGIKFQDAHGNMLPLTEVLGQFTKASKKAGGNMKQAAFFAELVGLRGQKAAIKLKGLLASGKYTELLDALKGAAGKAEEMANLRMDTLQGDWTKFSHAVEDVEISLFSMQSGPLRGVVQQMTDWVNANHALIETKLGEFVENVKAGLPEFIAQVRETGRHAYALFQTIRKALPDFMTAARRVVLWTEVFYGLWAALNVVKLGIYAVRGAVLAWNVAVAVWAAVTGAATAAQKLFAVTTAESTTAMEVATVANKEYAAAMAAWGAESEVAGGKFGGIKALLGSNMSALDTFGKKLGAAGMLGAALAVGVAIGSWLNKEFDLDTKISGWIARLTGVEEELDKAGGRATHRGVQEDGEHVHADGSTTSGAKGQSPSVSSSEPLMSTPSIASLQTEQMQESIDTSSSTTEKVEVTIHDKSGNATVKRGPRQAKGASIHLRPSGAF